jgi:hypothetical protein
VGYWLAICRDTNDAYVEIYWLCSKLFEVHLNIKY